MSLWGFCTFLLDFLWGFCIFCITTVNFWRVVNRQIFDAMRKGLEPATVECYDDKEARVLIKLRDKYRQGK